MSKIESVRGAASEASSAAHRVSGRKRLLVAAVVVVLVGLATWQWGDRLELARLARQEEVLRAFGDAHPLLAVGLAFLVYAAVTGLMLPGATALTLLLGWYFGFWKAVVVVSFASTTGATLAFLLSRYLLRDVIEAKFGDRLRTFNEALRKEGAYYLFTLRLIPLVPFFVINTVMGLTPMRTRTFWWVSQLGMLPGTLVYVYAGASVPSLRTLAVQGTRGLLSPQLFLAFALIGLLPLVTRFVVRRRRAT